MKKNQTRTLLLLAAMITVACSALAYTDGRIPTTAIKPVKIKTGGQGVVSLTGNLVQNKVVYNGNGEVGLELIITADDLKPVVGQTGSHADMVIVLDRSGSMQGDKINDARQAIST